MGTPYGAPSAPPPRRRTGVYVALACGCLLLAAAVLAVAGTGVWFLSRGGGEDSYPLRYASFTTSGPELPGGEEATALLYADVPVDMVPASIGCTDQVATGGQEITVPVG